MSRTHRTRTACGESACARASRGYWRARSDGHTSDMHTGAHRCASACVALVNSDAGRTCDTAHSDVLSRLTGRSRDR